MNRILDILRRYPVILEAQRNEAARDAMSAANTEAAVGTALTPYVVDAAVREPLAREIVAERRRQLEGPQPPAQQPTRRGTNWWGIGATAVALILVGVGFFHFFEINYDHSATPAAATPPVTRPAVKSAAQCARESVAGLAVNNPLDAKAAADAALIACKEAGLN